MSKKIEKLDGFTADGFGKVIGTEQDLVDGDVERITDGASVTEQRYYAPAPKPPAPIPPVVVTPPQLTQPELAALLAALPVIQKLSTAS